MKIFLCIKPLAIWFKDNILKVRQDSLRSNQKFSILHTTFNQPDISVEPLSHFNDCDCSSFWQFHHTLSIWNSYIRCYVWHIASKSWILYRLAGCTSHRLIWALAYQPLLLQNKLKQSIDITNKKIITLTQSLSFSFLLNKTFKTKDQFQSHIMWTSK